MRVPALSFQVSIGYWPYSKNFDDLVDSDAAGNSLKRKNPGTYLLMGNSVYRSDDMARDAAVFFAMAELKKTLIHSTIPPALDFVCVD